MPVQEDRDVGKAAQGRARDGRIDLRVARPGSRLDLDVVLQGGRLR
jgi:hypothetical protein